MNARPGKWREWVLFFLDVCAEQAEENITISRDMLDLHRQLKERAEKLFRSRYAAPLVDAMFARPVFAARDLRFAGARPGVLTLNKMINELVRGGVLIKLFAGRRGHPSAFMLAPLVKLLERG